MVKLDNGWTATYNVLCMIDRFRTDDGSPFDSDVSPHWCGIPVHTNAHGNMLSNGSESESNTPSDLGPTIKSTIKSFDTSVRSKDFPKSIMSDFV